MTSTEPTFSDGRAGAWPPRPAVPRARLVSSASPGRLADPGSAAEVAQPGAGGNPQELRRRLGRSLRAAREAAGWSQAQLARRTGHARSTISLAERGTQDMSRVFWQRCDDVLAPGTAFTAIHDRIAQIRTVTRSLDAGTVPEAMAAYQRMGWGADAADGRVVLVTGEGVDALEVPRATGVLAIRWWLYTGGRADEIRQLPSLPNPAEALAVIASANRHFFLAQSGAFPWAGPVAARADAGRTAPGPEVRWHTGGSRIPAPPSLPDTGHLAEWASRPPARMRLADPVVLLDLLSRVTVMTGHQDQALTMPGGLRVVPAE